MRTDEPSSAYVTHVRMHLTLPLAPCSTLAVILVDTQTSSWEPCELVNEVNTLIESTSPHHVSWIMDGNAGHAAGAEAEMLVKAVPNSAIILTKLDLGSLGAGAIAALAASNLPISFVACGEVMNSTQGTAAQTVSICLIGQNVPLLFVPGCPFD